MAKPHDVSWPPLNVKDLKPESPAIKEVMKFGTLREALLKIHRSTKNA